MLASGLPRSPTRSPNKGLICSHNWLRTLEIFKRRPAVAKAAAAFTPNPNSTCKPLPSICKYWDLPSESAELTGQTPARRTSKTLMADIPSATRKRGIPPFGQVSVTSSQPPGSGITFSAAARRNNRIAGYGREAASRSNSGCRLVGSSCTQRDASHLRLTACKKSRHSRAHAM